ncbi:hypothetical protein PFISCL1PPCAC_21244, partial [Pristionchus fissidentatus]
ICRMTSVADPSGTHEMQQSVKAIVAVARSCKRNLQKYLISGEVLTKDGQSTTDRLLNRVNAVLKA